MEWKRIAFVVVVVKVFLLHSTGQII